MTGVVIVLVPGNGEPFDSLAQRGSTALSDRDIHGNSGVALSVAGELPHASGRMCSTREPNPREFQHTDQPDPSDPQTMKTRSPIVYGPIQRSARAFSVRRKALRRGCGRILRAW